MIDKVRDLIERLHREPVEAKELLPILCSFHRRLRTEQELREPVMKRDDADRLSLTDPCRPGWAVVEPKRARDSSGLHCVRVEENPGSTGAVTALRTGRTHQAHGVVQARRAQARVLKRQIVDQRGLRRITAWARRA